MSTTRRVRIVPSTWYRLDSEASERRREYAEGFPDGPAVPIATSSTGITSTAPIRGARSKPTHTHSSTEFDATDDRDGELRRWQREALKKLDRLQVGEELAHTGIEQQACDTDMEDQPECRREVFRGTIALIVDRYWRSRPCSVSASQVSASVPFVMCSSIHVR